MKYGNVSLTGNLCLSSNTSKIRKIILAFHQLKALPHTSRCNSSCTSPGTCVTLQDSKKTTCSLCEKFTHTFSNNVYPVYLSSYVIPDWQTATIANRRQILVVYLAPFFLTMIQRNSWLKLKESPSIDGEKKMNSIHFPKITSPSFFTTHFTTVKTRTSTLSKIYQSTQSSNMPELGSSKTLDSKQHV